MAQVSSRSSAESRSEPQRVTLIGAALGSAMVAFVAAIRLGQLLSLPSHHQELEIALPVCDHMLLTAEEREQARRTNVGAYEFDGVYYVNSSLPEEYWTEWRSS